MTDGETNYLDPGSLGDKPVVVLTADTTLLAVEDINWVKANIWPKHNEDVARAENRVWKDLQEQYGELSSDSRHEVVKGSSHYVQFDYPEVVVEAIRQVVEAVRTGKPLVHLKR